MSLLLKQRVALGPGRRVAPQHHQRLRGFNKDRWAQLHPVHMSAQGPSQGPSQTNSQAMAPALSTLVLVTMLWGSYNPTIRYLYDSPHHLDPATLTGIRTAIAAGALGVALAIKPKHQHKHHPDSSGGQESETSDEDSPLPLTPEEGTAFVHQQDLLLAAGSECNQGQKAAQLNTPPSAQPASNAVSATAAGGRAAEVPLLSRTTDWVLIAGLELGIYNFLGTSLQAMGLQLTTATRAGFLVQLTAVIVPVLSALAGVTVSSRIWSAALLALSGTCLIALDGAAPGALANDTMQNTPPVAVGDIYLLGACFFYSLATVRLGFLSPKFNSVDLTAVKKFTLGAASFVWLASAADSFDGVSQSVGQQTPWEWFLIAYSALGPGALATYLQTWGQATVPATLAQVVYSLTPIWSAVMAYIVLGDDGMGPMAWAGSAAILVASIIATSSEGSLQLPFKLPALPGSTTTTSPSASSSPTITTGSTTPMATPYGAATNTMVASQPLSETAESLATATTTAADPVIVPPVANADVLAAAASAEPIRASPAANADVLAAAASAEPIRASPAASTDVLAAAASAEPIRASPVASTDVLAAAEHAEPVVASPVANADVLAAAASAEPVGLSPAASTDVLVAAEHAEPVVASPGANANVLAAAASAEPIRASPVASTDVLAAAEHAEPIRASPAASTDVLAAAEHAEPVVASPVANADVLAAAASAEPVGLSPAASTDVLVAAEHAEPVVASPGANANVLAAAASAEPIRASPVASTDVLAAAASAEPIRASPVASTDVLVAAEHAEPVVASPGANADVLAAAASAEPIRASPVASTDVLAAAASAEPVGLSPVASTDVLVAAEHAEPVVASPGANADVLAAAEQEVPSRPASPSDSDSDSASQLDAALVTINQAQSSLANHRRVTQQIAAASHRAASKIKGRQKGTGHSDARGSQAGPSVSGNGHGQHAVEGAVHIVNGQAHAGKSAEVVRQDDGHGAGSGGEDLHAGVGAHAPGGGEVAELVAAGATVVTQSKKAQRQQKSERQRGKGKGSKGK